MESQAKRTSHGVGESSRSMVLGNEGLLGDILLRVDSPTTLVRAALVSKRWYRGASFPALLRRFRELNPPRLMGVYVSGSGVRRPEFVQVPIAQPLEHVAAANGANFGFGDFPDFSSNVLDCRNGRVLYEYVFLEQLVEQPLHLDVALAPGSAMRTPLRYPGQDLAVFPAEPSVLAAGRPHAMLLPDDDGDNATCYRLDIDKSKLSNLNRVAAKVSVLRFGEWSVCCYAVETLAETPRQILNTTLLAAGKIYMMTMAGHILGLNLSTERFFVVELPEGVTYEYGNLFPCRGDDSTLHLVHVNKGGDKLSVWLRRADNKAGNGEWVLKDTFSVTETCGGFIMQGSEEAADGGDAPVEMPLEQVADGGDAPDEVEPEQADDDSVLTVIVVGAGKNGEFVFLELLDSGAIVYLHLRSKVAEKVYQRDPNDDNDVLVHPFMMVWPPVFPPLREDDEAEEGHGE